MIERSTTEPKSTRQLLAPLYGSLAASIVQLVVDAWEHPQPPRTVAAGQPEPIRAKAGVGFWGQFLSDFEGGCEALYLLGVGVPVAPECGPIGPHFLTVDGKDVAAFVERRAFLEELEIPSIDEVLAAFIGCAHHFGHILCERSEFEVHDDVRATMKCLSKNGFADKHGKKYSWTDAAGPAMGISGRWGHYNKPIPVGELIIDKSAPLGYRWL